MATERYPQKNLPVIYVCMGKIVRNFAEVIFKYLSFDIISVNNFPMLSVSKNKVLKSATNTGLTPNRHHRFSDPEFLSLSLPQKTIFTVKYLLKYDLYI